MSDLIDCSELNCDHGLVTVVPVSFAGVDSLEEMRFCFLLGCPLHFESCCCMSTPLISNTPLSTTTESHPLCFLSSSTPERKHEGAVVPVSFAGVDSLDNTRFCFFAGQSFALRDLLLLVYSSYLQFTSVHHCRNYLHLVCSAPQREKGKESR